MKKISIIILSLLFAAVFTLPVFASAATSPGVKPGNFFYFFDTSFEKIGLFFTFSPEKKARRALQYADERLAEIEGIAEEKDADAVKTAISNYENNVALAAEKSKEVTDKEKAENLLTVIEDNAAKNQDVLSVVLTKVPEEAREAILRAISASRKGQEEAAKQIAELKGEVEKLEQEVEELKAKDEEREKVIEELSKPKVEKPVTQQKISAPVAPTQKPEQPQTPPKTSIVTLPSGAVVETDTNGNILRYIKEAPVSVTTQTPIISITPQPTAPSTQAEALEIISVNLTVGANSAKFEWQTNKPTESKVFISGENFPAQAFYSESGLSAHHTATIAGLSGGRAYLYEIEAVTDDKNIARKHDGFQTASLPQSIPQPIIPEVKKEIRIIEVRGCDSNRDKVVTKKCRVEIWYSENNVRIPASITISAEKGIFYTIDDPIREGNPLTSNASSLNPYDNKPNIYFDYVPLPEQIGEEIKDNACIMLKTGTTYCGKTISYQWTINPTVSANGVTAKGEFTWTQHFPF